MKKIILFLGLIVTIIGISGCQNSSNQNSLLQYNVEYYEVLNTNEYPYANFKLNKNRSLFFKNNNICNVINYDNNFEQEFTNTSDMIFFVYHELSICKYLEIKDGFLIYIVSNYIKMFCTEDYYNKYLENKIA